MDLSKLPRLSGTEHPAPPPPEHAQIPTATATPGQGAPPVAPAAGEAWLSLAIGVIILLMGPRIIQWAVSPATFAQKWTFNDGAGQPLPYTQTVYFWGDLAVATFALALIFEGLVLGFTRRPIWIVLAIGVTALVSLFNLGYVIYMLQAGYGPQIWSILAVALGVYACIVLRERLRLTSVRI